LHAAPQGTLVLATNAQMRGDPLQGGAAGALQQLVVEWAALLAAPPVVGSAPADTEAVAAAAVEAVELLLDLAERAVRAAAAEAPAPQRLARLRELCVRGSGAMLHLALAQGLVSAKYVAQGAQALARRGPPRSARTVQAPPPC
jgi:hypothetical protein